MKNLNLLKFPMIRFVKGTFLLGVFCFFCQVSLAAQDAMVVVEKAVIYSDQAATSAVGYISFGKKIRIGEIPRNKAQVYPIIVSGKVAYIRARDVTTQKESMDPSRLLAERFKKNVDENYRSKVGLSVFNFASRFEEREEDFSWPGISLKGEVLTRSRYDFQIIANYSFTDLHQESFKMVEFGLGLTYRLLDFKRMKLKLGAEALSVPFISYALGEEFRVNSYGYTLGGVGVLSILFGPKWSLDLQGGIYRTSLFNFKVPAPYEEFSPVFIGVRAMAGLSYLY